MGKHTTILTLTDYSYKDLQKAISDNCEMTNLFWPQGIEEVVRRIAEEFYQDLKMKSPEEQLDYIQSYFGWALFIGVCMGAGKKAHLERHEENKAC